MGAADRPALATSENRAPSSKKNTVINAFVLAPIPRRAAFSACAVVWNAQILRSQYI